MQREIQATFNVITPLSKRRLIKQMVKAGLLVNPLSKVPNEHVERGKYYNSDDWEDASSEEDLDYLKWELEETGTLPPETLTMLRGVIQMPFKERKHPDRYDHAGASSDEEINVEL
jgi:hypothetical protein